MNQVGFLPVYTGRRYQRGGGILSSIGRVLLPIAKRGFATFAKSVARSAPSMIDNVMSNRVAPKQALTHTLAKAGRNVAHNVGSEILDNIGAKRKRKRPAPQKPRKRKPRPRDIFSA